jgi:tetratricopeptide (TPR) repeat protein
MAAADPFESYLKRAAELFDAGDIVQAGQIWQAILKKKPEHEVARAGLYKVKLYFDARATQGGLVGQKTPGEAGDVRATQGAPAKPQDPEITRLLEQGCTLYDAGHVEDALSRWVQVLAKEPDNVLAKGYIIGARRTLGTPEAASAAPALPAPAPAPVDPGVDFERLLRDGCTLFDMGQLEDALKKWEQILAHDPGHALARAYVQDARKDLGLPLLEDGARPVVAAVEAEAAAPQAVAGGEDERIERLIQDGVQLYDMGMLEEAKGKWQQVLDLSPGHKDAADYLTMAKRDLAPPPSRPAPVPAPASQEMSGRDFPGLQSRVQQNAPAPLELVLEEPTPPPAEPATPVTPPPALTAGTQKVRKGLNLPELLKQVALPAWMASPAFILGTIAGLVILLFGSFFFLRHRKDKALREAVAAFRASAVSPVARDSEIANLQQSPEEIRQEAQSALGDDALLAYLRAKECLRLDPGDAAAAQLLDRAKGDLAKGAQAASLGDFEKQLKDRDLEAADHTLTGLLSQSPDDVVLRERAVRLYGALVQAYASKEQWTEAEAHLRRARAMFPTDRSWSAKLRLLAHVQSLPRSERASWIQMLG